jgi:solute carrier family 25 2-oxodicarboxylate transporter 21
MCCRNCIWNGLYYGTMHEIEKGLPPLGHPAAEALRQLGVGMAVGMAATCFNAPFDVVKSRWG